MDCRYFDECSAPLCPKADNLDAATWFPDEDVCRLNSSPAWVTRQRKLARKGLPREAGYFTRAMLSHDCRWSGGTKGIDPDGTDKERADDEAAWLKAHPAITEEEREKMRARGEKNKAVLSRAFEKNTPST